MSSEKKETEQLVIKTAKLILEISESAFYQGDFEGVLSASLECQQALYGVHADLAFKEGSERDKKWFLEIVRRLVKRIELILKYGIEKVEQQIDAENSILWENGMQTLIEREKEGGNK